MNTEKGSSYLAMYIEVKEVVGNVSEISNLEVIGSFSVDGDRRYCNDLSQLKYYKEPPDITNVNFDLTRNNDTIYKYQNNCKIDNLLRWMSDHFDLLKIEDADNSRRWLQPEIVSMRGALKNIFLTPFERSEGWIICASKFKGTIYLCSFDSEEKIRKNMKQTDYARASTAWGCKFEQYMLSDNPNTDPNVDTPLNQNEEFCCIFKAQFDNRILLYAAEMDGVISQEIIKDTVAGKKIKFIELKTTHERELKHGKIEKFIKILRWWCQSYLVGIQEIICGCKDSCGRVSEIKKVKLEEYHRIKSSEERCQNFASKFLEYLKDVVHEAHDKCLYKFTYSPGTNRIQVQKMKPERESTYTFLSTWYTKKANDHFANL